MGALIRRPGVRRHGASAEDSDGDLWRIPSGRDWANTGAAENRVVSCSAEGPVIVRSTTRLPLSYRKLSD